MFTLKINRWIQEISFFGNFRWVCISLQNTISLSSSVVDTGLMGSQLFIRWVGLAREIRGCRYIKSERSFTYIETGYPRWWALEKGNPLDFAIQRGMQVFMLVVQAVQGCTHFLICRFSFLVKKCHPGCPCFVRHRMYHQTNHLELLL